MTVMKIVNSILCVVCLSCISVHVECDCKAELDESIIWTDNPENLTVTVDTSIHEKCPSSAECLNKDGNTSNILQLTPSVVQVGVKISILMMDNLNETDLFNVNKLDFDTCNFNNNIPVTTTHQNGSLVIDSKDLNEGSNYILLGTKDDCNEGNRVNITVVTKQNCKDPRIDEFCSGNGQCAINPSMNVFTCNCCAGYHGQYCESSIPTANNLCGEKECLNGGTCISTEDNSTYTNNDAIETAGVTLKCVCKPHFNGPYCEFRLDHCKSSPCVHGVCKERINTFQCYCIPGFHGNNCQMEYNECLSNPCSNGGTCIDRVDKYECKCSNGFTGRNCETKVNLCDPYPCHRNSTCVDHGNVFTCTCHIGFTGRLCDIRLDDCASNPCQNHGTCRHVENGFQCLCPLTFAGVHCEYMMDVFAPPMEGSDMLGKSHNHNLYIVAGTLSSAIVVILVVLVACYCKMHETYRQITWRRLRNTHRSISCPEFDSCNEGLPNRNHRLSVDAICEATSLNYNNQSMESSLHQPLNSHKI